MTFTMPCGWYHVVSCSSPGINQERDVQNTPALQYIDMDPSIRATSVNSSRFQKALILDRLYNNIQIQGTHILVMFKGLKLHPEVTNRHPS